MVAAATRYSGVLCPPTIEAEKCPSWAQPLIGITPPPDALGVPIERLSPEILQVQADLFLPAPVSEKKGKTYVKSWPIAFFQACLPYALAKQTHLFNDIPGDVAVLCFSKLCVFARLLGMSYDQTEQWMKLLICLGFIQRYRHGRRFLYVIPLSAYAPQPTAEAVRDKLNALIMRQFEPCSDPTGATFYRDRGPEYTKYLVGIRDRFEQRYNLPATEPLLMPLAAEEDLDALLEEIHRTVPRLSAEELAHLTPILRHRLLKSAPLRGKRFGRIWKPIKTIESTLLLSETKEKKESGASGSSRKSIGAGQKSRFCLPQTTVPRSQEGSQPVLTGGEQKVDSVLTLRNLSQERILKENIYVNVSEALLEQKETEAKATQCQALGEMLARVLGDEASATYFASIHRRGDPRLIRAALIKTICIGQEQGFRKSAGACFVNVYKRWTSAFPSYLKACEAWNKWDSRDSRGIPTRTQDLEEFYKDNSYLAIAESLGFRLDPVTGQPYAQDAFSEIQEPTRYFELGEAEALAEEIRLYASWYLPHVSIVPVEAHAYLVEAEGCLRYQFTSREQWLALHNESLALPTACESWYQNAVDEQERTCGDTMPTGTFEEEQGCVRAALAFVSYCNAGLYQQQRLPIAWERFSWAQLVRMGRPLCFPAAQSEQGEEHSGEVRPLDGQKERGSDLSADARWVLVDGEEVPFEEYNACYQRAQELVGQEEECQTLAGWLELMRGQEPPASMEGEWRDQGNEQARPACEQGMSRVYAEDGARKLTQALDPGFYEISVCPQGSDGLDDWVIVVRSLVSKNTWMFFCPEQVDAILCSLQDTEVD